MVRGEWLKEGGVVIDCGINYVTGLSICSHLHTDCVSIQAIYAVKCASFVFWRVLRRT